MHWIADEIRRVARLLMRRGTGVEDAQDLVQDAVLRLHVYTRQGGQVRDVQRFLTRVAINLSIDHHRRAHDDLYVQSPVEELVSLVETRPGPEEELVNRQRLEAMRDALDRVSRQTREIFFMHRLHGFSHAEIAGKKGISRSAVEKHIARAVTTLALWHSRERGGE